MCVKKIKKMTFFFNLKVLIGKLEIILLTIFVLTIFSLCASLKMRKSAHFTGNIDIESILKSCTIKKVICLFINGGPTLFICASSFLHEHSTSYFNIF